MIGKFRIWFGLWGLIAMFAWAPAVVAVEAGKVLARVGHVTAMQPGSQVRNLDVGSVVLGGDLIRTASEASVQIRYTDGALASLNANSLYRIDDYAYAPGERGFFSLLKGGLRTLTGLIGKGEPAAYRVNTPVATIGIRGTDYALRLCQNDCPPGFENGLYLSVFEGTIVAVNDVGEYLLKAGESAFIPAAGLPLRRRDDPFIGFGDLMPWHGAGGGGPITALGDTGVSPVLEFRATDLVRCTP